MELIRVVFVKHMKSEQHYAFRVPGHNFLSAGDYVICDTRYGEQVGRCVCDDFLISEEDIAPILNVAADSLKEIKAVLHRVDLEEDDEEDEDDGDAETGEENG